MIILVVQTLIEALKEALAVSFTHPPVPLVLFGTEENITLVVFSTQPSAVNNSEQSRLSAGELFSQLLIKYL